MKDVPKEEIWKVISFSCVSCTYCLLNANHHNNIKITIAKKSIDVLQEYFTSLYNDFENLSENGEINDIFKKTIVCIRNLTEVRINYATLMNHTNADTLIIKDVMMSIMMTLNPDPRYTIIMEHMTKAMIDLVDAVGRLHLDFKVIKEKNNKSLKYNSYPIIENNVKDPEYIKVLNKKLSKHDVYAEMNDFQVSNCNGNVLLKPTNLKIRTGKWYHLKGKSGSGKSLIFISAFLKGMRSDTITYKGDLLYFDKTLHNLNYNELIHYVSHLHLIEAIVQSFTVMQNFLLGNDEGKKTINEITRLKNLFEIDHIDDDARASACSTGEQQRIQLIRLILQNRPIWILDEATTNIDNRTAEICLNELRRIQLITGKIIIEVAHQHNHNFNDYCIDFNKQHARITKNKGCSNVLAATT
jgi:ABC-type lipoprotein export system ATPase subunit